MARRPSGLALLIVISVLGLISVLAMCFITVAQLERRATERRVNATRALLLARSGLEDVLARLALGQDPESAVCRYEGEDQNANAILDASEASAEIYGPGMLDRDACPLDQARRPSFCVLNASDPLQRPEDGRLRGYSGRLSGEASPDGNVYALKIASGGFHINGGDPAQPANVGYNAVLFRMMGILAREIGPPLAQVDGENLLSQRPLQGWSTFAEVRDLALGGSQAKLDALQPYLALRAWTDKRVIAPNATDGTAGSVNQVNKGYLCWGDIKRDRRNPAKPSSRAPDFERMPRTPAGRVVGRSPVDLAWARTRRPALSALLEGLSGLYLDEDTACLRIVPIQPAELCGTLRAVTLTATSGLLSTALNAFMGSGSNVSTWQQFNTFCDGIPFLAVAGVSTTDIKAVRDLIKANFNPNSDLNKFNPCRGAWKHVDKSDLLAYSTEFSLTPIQARRVECLGLVLAPSGRILARRTLEATVSPPGVVRLATQREMVSEDLGNLDMPGDERNPRLPGYCVNGTSAFLNPSNGTDRTWGQALDTTSIPMPGYSAASGNWMGGASKGVALQTYPEPCFDTTPNQTMPPTYPDATGTRLAINPADYAGGIQLAAVETARDAFYTAGSDIRRMTLLSRFDDGFDLDDWDTLAAASRNCLPAALQPTTAELGLSVWCSNVGSKLNNLYPDGAYCEASNFPSYYDKDNCHGTHGVLSFWVKTNYSLPYPHQVIGEPHLPADWRSHAFLMRTKTVTVSPRRTQFNFLGDGHGASGMLGFTLRMEIGASTDDDIGIEGNWRAARPAAHTWHLLTYGWDFLSALLDDVGELVVDGGAPGQVATQNSYTGAVPGSASTWTSGEDIAPPGHTLALGISGSWLIWGNLTDGKMQGPASGPDATLDELAIWDFGGASVLAGANIAAPPEVPVAVPKTLAEHRYAAGRYYKGCLYAPAWSHPNLDNEAGAWISAPLPLPQGSRLQEIRWTWYNPASYPAPAADLSTDYAEVELLKPDLSDYLLGPLDWASPDAASSRSALAAGAGPSLQSWRPGRLLPSPFRLRVLFERGNPTLVTDDTPILESPVLDDLMIVYLPPGGLRLLDCIER